MKKAAKDQTLTPPGEHVTDLVFPLSVDYVRGWTAERAVAELVSNAIDADPDGFTAEWSDGVLTIEDHAEGGVGAAGMVLGYTTKAGRSDVIGQFGEGLKIGLLVLLRETSIGGVMVDTVGYSFVPELRAHSALSGLGLTEVEDAPQVMSWRVHKSTRSRGTVVKVACSKKLADAVLRRFRYLSVPGYKAPEQTAVLFDEKPGSLYIGGVLISEKRKLSFSYDLPLAVAKEWQNRDRTVVDSWQLNRAIAEALSLVSDKSGVERLAEATLSGELSDSESGWLGHVGAEGSRLPAAVRKAWEAEGLRRWPDKKVFYRPAEKYGQDVSYDESILDLLDRGYVELVVPKLNSWQLGSLGELLGVQKPKAARQDVNDRRQQTVWTKDLTEAQQAVLDTSVAAVRAAFGEESLGAVKVFVSTKLGVHEEPDLAWNGFYEPTTGNVAIHIDQLVDVSSAMVTLFHEAAHRLAHKHPRLLGLPSYVEHADRTRGFEMALHTMGARLLTALVENKTLEDLGRETASGPDVPEAAVGMEWVVEGRNLRYVAQTSRPAGKLVHKALLNWASTHGVSERRAAGELARRELVSQRALKTLVAGTSTSGISYTAVKDIAAVLGLDAAIVWWASVGAQGRYAYKSDKSNRKRFVLRLAEQAAMATADLGPEHQDLVPSLTALVAGKYENDNWIEPVQTLLTRAEERFVQTSTQS